MKIKKTSKVRWVASETARGIKVTLRADGEKHSLGNDLFFDTIKEVQEFCKGEIEFITRKVVTKHSKLISK